MPERTARAPAEGYRSHARSGLSERAASMAGGGRSLAGRDQDIPAPAEDVVEVEGAARDAGTTPHPGAAVIARLFQPDDAPRAVPSADLPSLVSTDENFVWVELSAYSAADLQAVAELLHLRPAAVHAALSSWKRPRLDAFDDQFFVTATIPYLDEEARRVQARQLDLFVGRNVLVSAHKLDLPFAERALARAEQSSDLLHHDAAFMLYILLDELLGYYEQLHERMQGEIEAMEERALTDTSDAYLRDLLHFKRYAFALSQLAEQHREIFAAFLRPDFRWVSGEGVEVYYRDLEARLSRLADALLTAKEAVTGAFDIYVSHVSHRTNQVMKLLTIVSTVLLPATVILGFFGTNNVQSVPILTQTTGFVLMIVIIVAISGAALWTFHRKGWL